MVICPKCATQNDDGYTFCKECGTPLRKEGNEQQKERPQYNQAFNYERPEANDYDGVTADEMKCFVGKNKEKIMPKFSKMQLAFSKSSWCWPAAILGFLFGFFGLSFWFFYRKMNKVAFICVAIGVFLSVVQAVITFNANTMLYDQMFALFAQLMESLNLEEFMENIDFLDTSYQNIAAVNIASFISDLADYTAAILGGIFALHIYKTHAIKSIKGLKANAAMDNYYFYRIELLGGVSGGMAFLGVVIFLVVDAAADLLPMLQILL